MGLKVPSETLDIELGELPGAPTLGTSVLMPDAWHGSATINSITVEFMLQIEFLVPMKMSLSLSILHNGRVYKAGAFADLEAMTETGTDEYATYLTHLLGRLFELAFAQIDAPVRCIFKEKRCLE